MQGPPLDPVLRDVPTLVETARLTLRPPQPGDGPEAYAAVAESLADLRRFPASMRWALAEQSEASAEKYCREAHARFIARSDLAYFMFLRDTTTVVGATGLHRFDWTVPKFEIGYWGRSSYQGQGLVTEGVGALADMATVRCLRRAPAGNPHGRRERAERVARTQLPRLRAREIAQRDDRPGRVLRAAASTRGSPRRRVRRRPQRPT